MPQQFLVKFPKKINRVKLLDNRDRNRVNSEIQSGYQKRPFSHTPADGAARTRGGGEPHVIGKTVNQMLDHVSAPAPFRVICISGLKLEAVFAGELLLAVCSTIVAAAK